MADNDNSLIPGEWALKKVLGPTLDEIGEDVKKVYQVGRNKIVIFATKKIKNLEDGAKANLRVSRDVFWNGSFTDESICAEYFGGVLAASRSEDGKDDSGIYYTDIIKSLSSKQLYLHYVLYTSLNKLLKQDPSKKDLNVGMSKDLNSLNTFFFARELHELGLEIDTDFEALYRSGLINDYQMSIQGVDDIGDIHYVRMTPTSLGIQVFAISHNELGSWRQFHLKDYEDFEETALPQYCDYSVQAIATKAALSDRG